LVLRVPGRAALEGNLANVMAFAAMYGRQPMSEVKRMTITELAEFNAEIGGFLRRERGVE